MNPAEWFASDPANGASQIFTNSAVKLFVDADEYFVALRKEIEATGKDGWICWIGFEGSGETPMPADPNLNKHPSAPVEWVPRPLPPRPKADGDVTWFHLLAAATGRGASLRVLLNLHPKPDTDPTKPKKYKQANFDLVAQLNGLPRTLAINDFRYLYVNGTHHQKLVLVANESGLSAFVGTCDLESYRIIDRWCEVHAQIRGDAATELHRVFARRWAEHTRVFARSGSELSYLKPADEFRIAPPRSGAHLVQVSTTYGNPSRPNPFLTEMTTAPPLQVINRSHEVMLHTDTKLVNLGMIFAPISVGNEFFTQKDPVSTPLLAEAAGQAQTYAFAPRGHSGIYAAITHAIGKARSYIYLEDQYLVEDLKMGHLEAIVAPLVRKLREPGFQKLIVLCTRIDDINEEFLRTGWAHRKNVITQLITAAPDKVAICQYRPRGELGSNYGPVYAGAHYIHSKTWIFDDELLITGSANSNRRGYSHDSELDIGVVDMSGNLVRDYRRRLWRSRLNSTANEKGVIAPELLTDFVAAAKFWETPRIYGIAMESNREGPLEPLQHPDSNVDLTLTRRVGKGEVGFMINEFFNEFKKRTLWDYVVDPDGI